MLFIDVWLQGNWPVEGMSGNRFIGLRGTTVSQTLLGFLKFVGHRMELPGLVQIRHRLRGGIAITIEVVALLIVSLSGRSSMGWRTGKADLFLGRATLRKGHVQAIYDYRFSSRKRS